MSKNKLVLSLGDQEVTLKFNMGTLRRMKDLNGNDPFRAIDPSDMLGVIEMAGEIINAGIMTELVMDKPYFSQEQLDDHLTIPIATDVILAFSKAYSPDAPEVKDDTQRHPANVQ